jgi:hypothetical protein
MTAAAAKGIGTKLGGPGVFALKSALISYGYLPTF